MERREAREHLDARKMRGAGPEPSTEELPILSQVRLALWTGADAAAYEGARRLLDEAIEECAVRETAALAAAVPNVREAGRWRAVALKLRAARAWLRPDRRAAVRQVRDRCLAVLEQAVACTRIRTALSAGRARALDPEARQVRHDGTWWVRAGLGYVPAPPELTFVLDTYARTLAAADAAVFATGDGEVA